MQRDLCCSSPRGQWQELKARKWASEALWLGVVKMRCSEREKSWYSFLVKRSTGEIFKGHWNGHLICMYNALAMHWAWACPHMHQCTPCFEGVLCFAHWWKVTSWGKVIRKLVTWFQFQLIHRLATWPSAAHDLAASTPHLQVECIYCICILAWKQFKAVVMDYCDNGMGSNLNMLYVFFLKKWYQCERIWALRKWMTWLSYYY